MTKNFFHALNRAYVKYLRISGQATVLYGAATFSEDIDLWICPEEKNCPGREEGCFQEVNLNSCFSVC